MREFKYNLWTYPAQYRVITVNGVVKTNGEAVMGRGCAREAALRYPKLPKWLGTHILNSGNVVHLFPYNLITFPVKHRWWEEADIQLIERSTLQLLELVNGIEAESVVMPRPGCGNGKLDWADVKPILAFHLDDKFTVVSYDYE
jgi:hypothetical protein